MYSLFRVNSRRLSYLKWKKDELEYLKKKKVYKCDLIDSKEVLNKQTSSYEKLHRQGDSNV